jgi:hypothetical protein
LHQLVVIRFKVSQALIQFSLINRPCVVISDLPSMNIHQSRYLLFVYANQLRMHKVKAIKLS